MQSAQHFTIAMATVATVLTTTVLLHAPSSLYSSSSSPLNHHQHHRHPRLLLLCVSDEFNSAQSIDPLFTGKMNQLSLVHSIARHSNDRGIALEMDISLKYIYY